MFILFLKFHEQSEPSRAGHFLGLSLNEPSRLYQARSQNIEEFCSLACSAHSARLMLLGSFARLVTNPETEGLTKQNFVYPNDCKICNPDILQKVRLCQGFGDRYSPCCHRNSVKSATSPTSTDSRESGAKHHTYMCAIELLWTSCKNLENQHEELAWYPKD
jgi:hypothetical protein